MTHPFKPGDIVRRMVTAPLGRTDDFKVIEVNPHDGWVYDDTSVMHNPAYLERVSQKVDLPAHPDVVNHPSHYKTDGGIEAIDVLEQFDLTRDFRLGNAAKYILRAGKKDSELQDLKKAAKYLARYISALETGEPAW